MNSPFLRALRRHLLREALTLLLFTSLMLQSATAVAPGWWDTQQVLIPGATADDYTVANLGQLKSIASKAAAEMNSTLTGGAGADINALIAAWNAAPGADVTRDDYAALTIGQLKGVVKLFYDRLADVGVTPSGTYPWSGRNADDYALANLGQLKTVFSFEMTTGDVNQNGIPDVWELQMFGNLAQSASGDFDQDGLSNLAEYQDGTDPANADTDGDGFSDGEEVAEGTNPNNPPVENNVMLAIEVVRAEGDYYAGQDIFGDPISEGDAFSDHTEIEDYDTQAEVVSAVDTLAQNDPLSLDEPESSLATLIEHAGSSQEVWHAPGNTVEFTSKTTVDNEHYPDYYSTWWWWQHGRVRYYLQNSNPDAPTPASQAMLVVRTRKTSHKVMTDGYEDWVLDSEEVVSVESLVLTADRDNAYVVDVAMPYADNDIMIEDEVRLIPVSIGVYPTKDPYELATYRVSADQHEVTLIATVFVGEEPVGDGSQVTWELVGNGAGGSFSSVTTTTTNGFTSTKLTTSSNPGDVYKVICKPVNLLLPDDPDARQAVLDYGGGLNAGLGKAAPIEVVPGLAASSGMTHDDDGLTMPADGESEQEIAVTVKDQFGNTVLEGTPVSWHVKGLGEVKSQEIQTDADGVARATIVAGTVPGVQTVQVIADGGLHEVMIQNTPLSPTVVSASGTLDPSQSQSTTVTASFPGAADGAQVVWQSTRGTIVNAQTVVSGGQASATLATEPGPDGTAFVSATVGSATGWARIPLVSQGPLRVTAVSQPVLAENDAADGTLSVGTSIGGTVSAGYAASTEISIHLPGKGGQTASIGFGSLGVHDGARFAFDAQDASGLFQDDASLHSATPAAGAVLDTDERYTGAGSVKFAPESSLSLDASATYDLRAGFIWQGWVKPDQLGGDLVYHPGQYRLLMDAGGVLSFSVSTSSGEQTVTLPQPLTAGAWQYVTARYLGEQGGITLRVGTDTAQAAAPGTPAAGTQAAMLGGGFAGWLDEVLIGAESSGGDVGLYLTTDQPANTITLDADGRGSFTVSSSGQMDPAVDGAAKSVAMQVQVGSDPVQTIPQVFVVADKTDIVRMEVMLDAAQPGESLTEEERWQIIAGQLGKMARSGQRCDAANLPVSGTLGQQAEAGFQMGMFIGKGGGSLGEAAYVLRLFGDTQMAAFGENAAYLRERVAQFAEEAGRQGSDAAAQNYISQNGGALVEELAKYCRDKLGDQRPMVDTIEFGPIPADVYDKLFTIPDVLDGQEAVEDFSRIAQKDPGLFANLLDCVEKGAKWTSEAVRYTGKAIADGFNYVTAPLNDLIKWKTKVIAKLEDFIKKSVEEGLADGSIDEDSAFKVGATWGAVRQITDMLDIISPEVAGQMISALTSTVIGALKGDAKSKEALADMAPLVGTWKTGEEVTTLMGEGQWFDAGMKFTEFAISATEDAATVYGSVTGVVAGVAGAVKILRKALKKARPPRGALSPRKLPDFIPNECPPSRLPASVNRHGDAPLPTESMRRWEKYISEEFDTNVSVFWGETAKTLIDEYDFGTFSRTIINGKPQGIIIFNGVPDSLTLFHETTHARHWRGIGDAAYVDMMKKAPWEAEFVVYREILRERWRFTPDQLLNAREYVKSAYKGKADLPELLSKDPLTVKPSDLGTAPPWH